MTEDEIVGWHHQLNVHEFEQAPGVGSGQGSLACCSPWGHKDSDMTEWLNRTEWLILLSIFSYAYWPSHVFFGEVSVQGLCLFKSWVVVFLLLIFRRSVHNLDINLIIYMICKYFLSFCDLPFYSVNTVSWYTKFFYFHEISNFSLFFYPYLCFCCHIQEIIGISMSWKFALCFLLTFLYFKSCLHLSRSLIHFYLTLICDIR